MKKDVAGSRPGQSHGHDSSSISGEMSGYAKKQRKTSGGNVLHPSVDMDGIYFISTQA